MPQDLMWCWESNSAIIKCGSQTRCISITQEMIRKTHCWPTQIWELPPGCRGVALQSVVKNPSVTLMLVNVLVRNLIKSKPDPQNCNPMDSTKLKNNKHPSTSQLLTCCFILPANKWVLWGPCIPAVRPLVITTRKPVQRVLPHSENLKVWVVYEKAAPVL